eukprot:6190684-Pleurochrysis_carterae.AAC.3
MREEAVVEKATAASIAAAAMACVMPATRRTPRQRHRRSMAIAQAQRPAEEEHVGSCAHPHPARAPARP